MAPLFIVIAIVLLVMQGAPLFYRQQRLGLDGQTLALLQRVKPGLTDPVALALIALAFVAEDEVLAGLNALEALYLERLLPEKSRRQVAYTNSRNALRDLLVILQTPRLLWSRKARLASAARVREVLAENGKPVE